MLKLFIAQKSDESATLNKNLKELFHHLPNDMFQIFAPDNPDNIAERLSGLLNTLLAAQSNASRLAEGIFLLYDASTNGYALLNSDTLHFLKNHLASADQLADLLIIFHLGLGIEISAELLSFLTDHLEELKLFFQLCADDSYLHDWVIYITKMKWIEVNSFKRLLEHPYQLTAFIRAISNLDQLDSALCGNTNLIIQNIETPIIFSWIDTLVQRYKEREMKLTDSGATLLLLAAMEGQLDFCKLLVINGVDASDILNVKIGFLQQCGHFEEDLAEFVKAKIGSDASDPETKIPVTVKEIAQLLNRQDIVAFLVMGEKEPAAAHLQTLGSFAPDVVMTQPTNGVSLTFPSPRA